MYQQLFIPHTLHCQIGNSRKCIRLTYSILLEMRTQYIYDHFTGTNCKSKHNIFTN